MVAHTGTGWRGAAARGRTALAALGAAVVAAWAAPARAEPGVDGRLEVRAGLLRFDYEERDRNAFLDGEEGFVPLLAVEGEVRVDRFFGRATFRLAKGSVDYSGAVNAPTNAALDGLPLRTTSDATFLQGELQAGGFLDEARRLALFGAFGARQWTRDIHDATIVSGGVSYLIGGYPETYGWYELQAGARWIFLQLARTAWDVDARVVRTAGANISVDLSRFGESSPTMGLGSRTGWRVGSTLRQDLQGTLFLAATVWAEGYAFGMSAVHAITTPTGPQLIHEPDSSTVNAGLEVGIGGRF